MKIKDLPLFQRAALKQSLTKKNLHKNCVINFNGSISLKRMSSYWYGGNMADVIYKGYTFHIEAIGDVRAYLFSKHSDKQLCYVKDKNNVGAFKHEMAPYFRSDKSLDKLLRSKHHLYDLEIEDNNWWECFVTDPQGKFHDIMWALDSDSLFDAIDEVLDSLDEMIQYIKEDAA